MKHSSVSFFFFLNRESVGRVVCSFDRFEDYTCFTLFLIQTDLPFSFFWLDSSSSETT